MMAPTLVRMIVFLQLTDLNANLFWKFLQRDSKIVSYQLSGYPLAQWNWHIKLIIWTLPEGLPGINYQAEELLPWVSHKIGGLHWTVWLWAWRTSMWSCSPLSERQWIFLRIWVSVEKCMPHNCNDDQAPAKSAWEADFQSSLGKHHEAHHFLFPSTLKSMSVPNSSRWTPTNS